MSTINEREALRRALHLADAIEPSADGLQRIQSRLGLPRPLALAWAEGAWTYLRMRVPDELRRLWEWLLTVAGSAWERFGPKSGTSGGVASRTIGWLRPAAVLGVTIFIVALGTYVAIDAQQAINPSASNSIHSGGAAGVSGGQNNPGGTNSQGHSAFGSTGTSRGTGKSTCRSSGTTGSSSSKAAGQTQNTSPSVSPSDAPGSLSPSPGINGSSSPSPGATTTGSATGAGNPAVGTSSPSVATLANPRVMARGSVPTPSPSPCARRSRHPASPTPNASPAVFSYGRLDGES